jgi:cyanate permease
MWGLLDTGLLAGVASAGELATLGEAAMVRQVSEAPAWYQTRWFYATALALIASAMWWYRPRRPLKASRTVATQSQTTYARRGEASARFTPLPEAIQGVFESTHAD